MGLNDDYAIRLTGLKTGVYNYCFEVGDRFFDEFKNEEIEGGNVKYSVKMERLERMIVLNFSFEGTVTTTCDRCLGPMSVNVSGEEHLSVHFSDTEKSDDEQTVILPEDCNEVDLREWLYEFVAVMMPLQHTHEEGECDPEMTKYLVDSDAEKAEGTIDPRWEALLKMKDEGEGETKETK